MNKEEITLKLIEMNHNFLYEKVEGQEDNIVYAKVEGMIPYLKAKKIMGELFDHFESRTCEGCEHYLCESHFDIPMVKIKCKLLDGLKVGLETKDFSCNKWEVKK